MATNTDCEFFNPGWIGANSDCQNGNFACVGTGDVAAALRGSNTSQYWCHNAYYGYNKASWAIYSLDISAIPTYVKINSVTGYWYEGRSGTNPGQYRMEYYISGVVGWTTYIAQHVAAPSWTVQSGTMSSCTTRYHLSILQNRIYSTNGSGTDRQAKWYKMFVRVNWEYITPLSLTITHSSVTATGAYLSGSYNANGDGDTEWRIAYKVSGGSYDTPSWNAETGTGNINVNRTLSGLTPGTLHYYRLEVRNHGNEVFYSTEGSFTTLSGGNVIVGVLQ